MNALEQLVKIARHRNLLHGLIAFAIAEGIALGKQREIAANRVCARVQAAHLRNNDSFPDAFKQGVKALAAGFEVSTKTVNRNINDLKNFLADRRELVGNAELVYSQSHKTYRLVPSEFLTNKELFLLAEILLASRALSGREMTGLIDKLRRFSAADDRQKLDRLIRNEKHQYSEVWRDCESVTDTLWQLAECIDGRREITIGYYRADRELRSYRLMPASVMFSEFYFYLIAFETGGDADKPKYYRIDRIKSIVEHRSNLTETPFPGFDEGLLRRRSLLMWSGKLRTIRFEYTGPSVRAILDKLPTAKVIGECEGGSVIEAEVYGDGIRMWLLSQGSYVRVTAPAEFVLEMKTELEKMTEKYGGTEI